MEPVELPISEIYADDEFNCRGNIAPIDVVHLAKDIQRIGLLSPIVVQPFNKNGKKYRVVCGYRRLAAFKINQATTIPAFIKEGLSDLQARVVNLGENINRKDLNLLQEAKAILPFKAAGWSGNRIAEELGVNRGWLQIRLALLDLPEEIQKEAAAGIINQQHILQLHGMPKTRQFEAVKRIKEAKERGQKVVTIHKDEGTPKAAFTKKARKKDEIFEKIVYILQVVGEQNLGSRALAWASGEISDNELEEDIINERNLRRRPEAG